MLLCKICFDNCKVRITFVTSNFTTMKDYKKQLTLLPHKWQVYGFEVLIVLAVLFAVLYLNQVKLASYDNLFTKLLCVSDILFALTLLVICFSQEKIEDEYTTSVRYRAVTIAIIIFFISKCTIEMFYGPIHRAIIPKTDFINDAQFEFMLKLHGNLLYRIAGILSQANVIQIVYIILLKVLLRMGGGNIYRSLLLPHKCKKIGWIMLIASFAIIVTYIIVTRINFTLKADFTMEDVFNPIVRILPLLPYISIFLICLSREEQEDEFISHIRIRLLAFFAILFVLASFFNRENFWFNIFIENHYYTFKPVLALIRLFDVLIRHPFALIIKTISWIPALAIIYAFVLKIKLNRFKKECLEND